MSVFGLIGHCNKRVKTHFQADSEKRYMMMTTTQDEFVV